MILSTRRDLRKVVYRLQDRKGPIGRAVFGAALYCYRCLDSMVLKRAFRPDLASEKYLMRDFGVLYVGVPKVATRSLLKALTSVPAAENHARVIAEIDIETLLSRFPESNDCFKFTFVRNPWSRIASCYRDKIVNSSPIKRARHLHNRYGLQPGMPFDEFAEWLNSAEGSDDVADRHWMSQHKLLGLDRAEPVAYDFIGRFERLGDDYLRLLELTRLDLPQLSHQLRTQSPNQYRELYSDRSVELIENRYARDIDLFDYAFGAD